MADAHCAAWFARRAHHARLYVALRHIPARPAPPGLLHVAGVARLRRASGDSLGCSVRLPARVPLGSGLAAKLCVRLWNHRRVSNLRAVPVQFTAERNLSHWRLVAL